MFNAAGLPDSVPQIVKDAYVEEVSTFSSQALTQPLTDILFGEKSMSAKEAREKILETQRGAFSILMSSPRRSSIRGMRTELLCGTNWPRIKGSQQSVGQKKRLTCWIACKRVTWTLSESLEQRS
jgi:hypothetical protein